MPWYTRWSASAAVLHSTSTRKRKSKSGLSIGRQRMVEQILSLLPSLPSQLNSVSEMAVSIAKDVLDAVAEEVPPPPRRTHKLECASSWKPQPPLKLHGMRGRKPGDPCALRETKTTWGVPRTACANLGRVIDAGLQAYFEECLAETQTERETLLADNDQRMFL